MSTNPLRLGEYTIQQKSTGRFVDAHESDRKDFALMTRPRSDYVPKSGHLFFMPPVWILTPVGDAYTIQQKRSRRFVDAHEIAEKDFAIVTRPEQNNDTQRWIIRSLGDNIFTIQQKNSGRFVDAHEIVEKDFALVTRSAQENDTQRWVIAEFFPEG